MTEDLFAALEPDTPWSEPLAEGCVLLHHFAAEAASSIWQLLPSVLQQAPLRQMVTPGGLAMSVRSSSCGHWGWVSDRRGYRYTRHDPQSGLSWPALPSAWVQLAQQAAKQAGVSDFVADSCLINCYTPGAKMSLHQDKDEQDFSAPIVSLSLGLAAVFLLGGKQRVDKVSKIILSHGDVLILGGPARLRFHGVATVSAGNHPLVGGQRFNLTFRKAG
ncbi:DNA oxidative demethylase AlkB [Neisseriaceae bacterium TC5R-5]|nr:DNA oxidative demethylase AlkB [Neisseriaceae bacterium TC5R-5]